jgi:hypothetical protein
MQVDFREKVGFGRFKGFSKDVKPKFYVRPVFHTGILISHQIIEKIANFELDLAEIENCLICHHSRGEIYALVVIFHLV